MDKKVVITRFVNVWVVVYIRSFGARMDEDEVLHEYLSAKVKMSCKIGRPEAEDRS
jgi:hypothetical protein